MPKLVMHDEDVYFDCDCGSRILKKNFKVHMKTKKHMDSLKVQQTRGILDDEGDEDEIEELEETLKHPSDKMRVTKVDRQVPTLHAIMQLINEMREEVWDIGDRQDEIVQFLANGRAIVQSESSSESEPEPPRHLNYTIGKRGRKRADRGDEKAELPPVKEVSESDEEAKAEDTEKKQPQ